MPDGRFVFLSAVPAVPAMRALRDSPFPFETVRDLLGILRMLYVATEREGIRNERRLSAIARVGRELKQASELARRYAPGSLGFTAAWERAEAAVLELGTLVDGTTPLEPTLRAAGDRIRRLGAPGARERRRRASRERS